MKEKEKAELQQEINDLKEICQGYDQEINTYKKSYQGILAQLKKYSNREFIDIPSRHQKLQVSVSSNEFSFNIVRFEKEKYSILHCVSYVFEEEFYSKSDNSKEDKERVAFSILPLIEHYALKTSILTKEIERNENIINVLPEKELLKCLAMHYDVQICILDSNSLNPNIQLVPQDQKYNKRLYLTKKNYTIELLVGLKLENEGAIQYNLFDPYDQNAYNKFVSFSGYSNLTLTYSI